jgi:hypothetical protein
MTRFGPSSRIGLDALNHSDSTQKLYAGERGEGKNRNSYQCEQSSVYVRNAINLLPGLMPKGCLSKTLVVHSYVHPSHNVSLK